MSISSEGRTAHVDTFVRDRLPPREQQPDFLFDLPELQYPERLNAAVELIDRHDPTALAVVNDAGRWTYGDMKDLSDRIARLLIEEEGLVPGNRVFLRGPNAAMLFASWLGVLKAGGIVVATMPILRPGEIATVLERAQVSHAIVDSRFIGDFRQGRSRPARSDRCCATTAITVMVNWRRASNRWRRASRRSTPTATMSR